MVRCAPSLLRAPLGPVLGLALLAAGPSQSACAPEPLGAVASGQAVGDTVRIRFSLDPEAAGSVASTEDLIAVLRKGLFVSAETPLDFPMTLHIGFRTYQSRADWIEVNEGYDMTDPRTIQGTGLHLDVTRGEPVEGLVSKLPFQTMSDFDSDGTWALFRERVQSSLAWGTNSSGAFRPGDDGLVPLHVEEVLGGAAAVEPDGVRMVLEVTAELLYRDGSKFGSRTPPEGTAEVVETVQLVLAPGAGPMGW
jgi:hypothetical protein